MGNLSERELVRWLAETFGASGERVGIGDDAAVLDRGEAPPLGVTIDTIHEGRHFERSTDRFKQIGRKAVSVSLSDLAAIGACPQSLLVSTGLDQTLSDASKQELFKGIQAACRPFDCSVIGGDLYETEALITITTVAIGTCPHGVVRRSGLSDGDVLYVTGALGGSLKHGRHLSFVPRVRTSEWLVQHGYPTAMMDVSDGLVIDLDRMLEASGATGAELEESKIPIHPDARDAAKETDKRPIEHALYDGEDFELLFATSPARASNLERAWSRETALTRIGQVHSSREGIFLMQIDGTETRLSPDGYQHF